MNTKIKKDEIIEESYDGQGYTDLYIKYLKNGKKSSMTTEQDVFKYYKKNFGNAFGTDGIKKLKKSIEEIKRLREEYYKKSIKGLSKNTLNYVKDSLMRKSERMYPYELLFMYQY